MRTKRRLAKGRRRLLLLAFLGWGGVASATPRVYRLDLTYGSIVNNADPQLYEVEHGEWTTAVSLTSGVEQLTPGGWGWFLEPRFHFESAGKKVLTGGLYHELGVRLSPWMDFYWGHHSRHVMDREPSAGSRTRYPLHDSFNLRFHFVQPKR